MVFPFSRRPRRELERGQNAALPGDERPSRSSDEFGAALIAQLPRLRRYAIALVGDLSFADDLVQDCAERALRRRELLRDEPRVFGWLRTILHNLYVDELRRRRGCGKLVDLDELANSLAESAPSAERMSTIDFVQAIGSLSVEHRQVLLLVGLEGLSYREAAAELGIPLGTVMSRLMRARQQLRAALDRAATEAPTNRQGVRKIAD